MVPDDTSQNSGIRGRRHRLLGPRASDGPFKEAPRASDGPFKEAPRASDGPVKQAPSGNPKPALRRVLFLCIGNSCRSQMAEAFAKKYGADVMQARSAGLSPATIIAPLTKQTMAERNISLDGQFPKMLDMTNRDRNELVINISGDPVQLRGVPVIDWDVRDPIGESDEVFQAVADQLEALVMRLILDIRNGAL